MTTFADAVRNTPVLTRTTNGMTALESTCRANVDLFGKLGSLRGQDVTALFGQAMAEDAEVAIRVALWGRDVRGGAGERKLFRDILLYIEATNPRYITSTNLLNKVPELGRWDDLLIFKTEEVKSIVYGMIRVALEARDGLCAKWMPRKGPLAAEIRSALGMSPKFYRKRIVELTKVVETQMCNREYEAINFSHVPSLAMSRYTKAFAKNAPEQFKTFKEALVKGTDPKVKVNAAAVYPYDIVKTLRYGDNTIANAQWDALPNFIGEANILPLVDVSGSMSSLAGGGAKKGVAVTCLDVAISLGMYCASKNVGKFKDLFLTFSSQPQFVTLKGSLSERYNAMNRSAWEMNTNIEAALTAILKKATTGRVPASEMPSALLIMSDMQFDSCVYSSSTGSGFYSRSRANNPAAIEMIRQKYVAAGYTPPAVIFWNIGGASNVPVKFDETGTALISGFSPAIMKSVLAADLKEISPEGIMLKTVMSDRYDFR